MDRNISEEYPSQRWVKTLAVEGSELTETPLSLCLHTIKQNNNTIMLDTTSDKYIFVVNHLGYMTYAIDTERNKKRIKQISEANAANYQKNEKGGWLWNRYDAMQDIQNILSYGVIENETLRISRKSGESYPDRHIGHDLGTAGNW